MATHHLLIKMFGDELTDRLPNGRSVSYNLPMETRKIEIKDSKNVAETVKVKLNGDEVANRDNVPPRNNNRK
ncbi:MAG: hypothetical protein ACHQAX_10015 [Gammaproteobacteria bacterium]